MERSRASEGKRRRLLRIIAGKYAMSVRDVARNLRITQRHAWRYISELEAEGKIYLRYRQKFNYYSLRRNNETGQSNTSTEECQGVIWFRYD